MTLQSFLILGLVISIGMTFLALITGVVLMGIGGQLNKRYSNALMIVRVVSQAISILFLFILFLIPS